MVLENLRFISGNTSGDKLFICPFYSQMNKTAKRYFLSTPTLYAYVWPMQYAHEIRLDCVKYSAAITGIPAKVTSQIYTICGTIPF